MMIFVPLKTQSGGADETSLQLFLNSKSGGSERYNLNTVDGEKAIIIWIMQSWYCQKRQKGLDESIIKY